MSKYVSLSLVFLVASCVGPDYERPITAIPSTWKNSLSSATERQKPWEVIWWQNFHDEQLEKLIEDAVKSNMDYQTALARIREARASYSGVVANLFPTLRGIGSAGQSYSGSKVQRNSTTLTSSSGVNTSNNSQSTNSSQYMAGFDATWELDFFGGAKRAEESALAILESVEEDARAILLTLLADVAQNYINLRSAQQQRDVLKEIVALWTENLKLQASLEKTGLNSQITTLTARSALDQASALLQPLEASIKITLHHLSILLGKEPTALYPQLLTGGVIPSSSEKVIAGLPFELITRRPDIRASEKLLASATAQIGTAKAALFPQFQLTGNYGFQRNQPRHLFNSGSNFWQYGLSFTIPIFDFGKIQAQIDAKYAQKDEALFAYQKSILTALEEVENGLVSYATESKRHDQLKEQVTSLDRVYKLTLHRYKSGLNSYLDVIQAKLSVLNAQLMALQSQTTVSLNLVSLYKGLGGGWETFEATNVVNLSSSNTCD